MNQTEARTIPIDVAVCPICNKSIWIEEVLEVEECEDGTLNPMHINLTCSTEPDIDSSEWEEWHRWHFSSPYIDWLPIANKIEGWLRQNQDRITAIWHCPK